MPPNGLAIEDVVAAGLAYRSARETGLGTPIPLLTDLLPRSQTWPVARYPPRAFGDLVIGARGAFSGLDFPFEECTYADYVD